VRRFFSAINRWEIFLTRLVEGSGFIWWSWDLNLQHDLGGPVKVDSSFWTIGEFLCCLFIRCSLLSPSSSQYSLMSEKLVFRCLMNICIRTFWLIDLVCVEDRIMHVTLQKRQKGQPWPSAIAGHGNLDAFTADQEQRRLMLERFQEEVCMENFVLFLLHPKSCSLNLSQSASSPSLPEIRQKTQDADSVEWGCLNFWALITIVYSGSWFLMCMSWMYSTQVLISHKRNSQAMSQTRALSWVV